MLTSGPLQAVSQVISDLFQFMCQTELWQLRGQNTLTSAAPLYFPGFFAAPRLAGRMDS